MEEVTKAGIKAVASGTINKIGILYLGFCLDGNGAWIKVSRKMLAALEEDVGSRWRESGTKPWLKLLWTASATNGKSASIKFSRKMLAADKGGKTEAGIEAVLSDERSQERSRD
jgi:hypothetical protein